MDKTELCQLSGIVELKPQVNLLTSKRYYLEFTYNSATELCNEEAKK